jgi:NADH dehydrogenase
MEEEMSQARIIIVGGGFGGLAAAKALRNMPAEIILINRTNHNAFQPLLYQVATSVLSPAQIGSPIRGLLRNQKNTTVILGEVTGVAVREDGSSNGFRTPKMATTV